MLLLSLTLHGFLAYFITAYPDPTAVDGGNVGILLLVPIPAILFLGFVVAVRAHSLLKARSSAPLSSEVLHRDAAIDAS